MHDSVDSQQGELLHLLVSTGLYFAVLVDEHVGAAELVGRVDAVVSEVGVLLDINLTAILVLEKAELRADLFVVDSSFHSLVAVEHGPEGGSGVSSYTGMLLPGLQEGQQAG